MRLLWKHYYENTEAIIFVVDSTDDERIEEVKEDLHHMLSDETLRDSHLLVLANKQDLPGAMSVPEIVDKLGLQTLRNRKWYVQASSAKTGDGLYEGLDWLNKTVAH